MVQQVLRSAAFHHIAVLPQRRHYDSSEPSVIDASARGQKTSPLSSQQLSRQEASIPKNRCPLELSAKQTSAKRRL